MNLLLAKPFELLPALDWLALALFFAGWVGYALWAKRRAEVRPSILATTNRWRRRWMLQVTWRENRIVDSAVAQSLSASPSFFASTSILIIGGLLAALASTEKATELVQELPFAARTSALVFDLKLATLAAIFVFAFFRFTWSIRQYSFGVVMVGAAPDVRRYANDAERELFADRAGRVMGLAAETFNDGLRAYYLSFAVVAWFVSAWAFIGATVFVLWVLYRREFHSEVLHALRAGLD
ncbi:DUF599 domain-containing protein [Aquabacterium sp. OR-4]|uniref:DUF599 domain-containing protein n=1 Tax=Aquabacterium sp. OR-4 TaxID=2978127 RepID=UPI0021B2E121|nr:DUF599 domain-containing protein [Aquabacterium sp. OR-4]MDT7836852.1 DUF599 domain-containing protein [Aquabacterium sp. OR-4]